MGGRHIQAKISNCHILQVNHNKKLQLWKI